MTIPSVHAVVTQFQHAEAEASRWQKAAVFAESRISPTVAATKTFEEDVVLFGRYLARRRRFLSKLPLGLNFPVTPQMLADLNDLSWAKIVFGLQGRSQCGCRGAPAPLPQKQAAR